ncbi:MAG: SUMF1/EgtB/PvdO family nonheme iron enzyme [Bacteroidetes bacterium]|nr:SUMF1/EgtB/PvdO family nonheme iron enzyme [Bacteroidota bacterium]
MKTFKTILIGCIIAFANTTAIYANNLQIGIPTVATATTLTFTIQWDNSWRVSSGTNNYDAVWIFAKYQNCSGTNDWNHVTLAAGSSVSGGVLQVVNTSDGLYKGIFVQRSADGIGNISSSTVTLQMSFADASYNYQVFAMEMVYVPVGSFYVGDNTSNNRCYLSPAGTPFNVTSDGALALGANFYANSTNYAIALAYPLGYDAFYSMKYEISQEQYAKFLSTLTYAQQTARMDIPPTSAPGTYALGTGVNRNGICIKTSGVFNTVPAIMGNDLTPGTIDNTNDGQNIACNWLSWEDLLAYLDWSALRPMTEFEFEKICRGPNTAVANEYPWATTTITQAPSSALTNPQLSTEVSTATGDGLTNYGNGTAGNYGPGPNRVGQAARAATTQQGAGAAWYGALDMAGNVWEHCILVNATITNAAGDGAISAAGAQNQGWPTYTSATRRGSAYSQSFTYCKTSDRTFYNTPTNTRNSDGGGRGVRMP